MDQVDYRTAIVNPLVRNEEILYQLNGMSMYSSTNTEEMWNFVKNMGFENLENRFQYAGSTEVMDMLLGIRYLFCRNTRTLHTAYKKIAESQSFDLYENPRALRSGYMVSDSVLDYAMEGTDPLEVQNLSCFSTFNPHNHAEYFHRSKSREQPLFTHLLCFPPRIAGHPQKQKDQDKSKTVGDSHRFMHSMKQKI